jgi:hypothetical protein
MRPLAALILALAMVVVACIVLGLGPGSGCATMSVIECSAAAGPLRAGFGVAALAATLFVVVAAAAFVWQARQHGRLAGYLARNSRPQLLGQVPVAVVEELTAPAVAGLFRPTIFWPSGLEGRLADGELAAVLLHERHHQRTFAPVRLAALAAVEPVLNLRELGRRWLEHQRAGIEIAADAYAIQAGACRSDLARALLELASDPIPIAGAGFGHASDIRLLHLVGLAQTPRHERLTKPLVLGAVAGLIACGFLAVFA